MSKFPMELSQSSIKAIGRICKVVGRKCSDNQMSVELAEGIPDYIQDHGRITEKQAIWVCRNADYWKLKRPAELIDLVVGRTTSAAAMTPSADEQIGDSDEQIDGLTQKKFDELTKCLKRIENKLDDIADKL